MWEKKMWERKIKVESCAYLPIPHFLFPHFLFPHFPFPFCSYCFLLLQRSKFCHAIASRQRFHFKSEKSIVFYQHISALDHGGGRQFSCKPKYVEFFGRGFR
jgi:hypothetical protein